MVHPIRKHKKSFEIDLNDIKDSELTNNGEDEIQFIKLDLDDEVSEVIEIHDKIPENGDNLDNTIMLNRKPMKYACYTLETLNKSSSSSDVTELRIETPPFDKLIFAIKVISCGSRILFIR